MRHDHRQTIRSPASWVTVTPMLTISDLERHRAAIAGLCYRMLGSVTDADDAVQETMLRAWRHLDGFEGRSSVRTWLYRIAARVCLLDTATLFPRFGLPAELRHDDRAAVR